MKILRVVLLMSLVANAGCGFYLRGSRVLDLEFSNVYVASHGADSLIGELRKQLGYGGVTVVRMPGDAEAVMVIWNEKPVQEIIYLGDDVHQIDIWGRMAKPEQREHRQVINGILA